LSSTGSTNAFSPQGATFDHASIFDALGALYTVKKIVGLT